MDQEIKYRVRIKNPYGCSYKYKQTLRSMHSFLERKPSDAPYLIQIKRHKFDKWQDVGLFNKTAHYLFISELPFAPPDREANEDEAEAFVSRNGNVHWTRCERHLIEF